MIRNTTLSALLAACWLAAFSASADPESGAVATLKAQKPDGTFGLVQMDDGGHLVPSSYYLEVVRGSVGGVSAVHKFGSNPSIENAATYEVIWDGSTVGYTGFDAVAAEVITIESTDINDDGDPASTGALTLTIYGLDASWAIQSETVTLDGTTKVDTAGSYIRVHRMIVNTAGSSDGNEGTITATQKVTTANIMSKILPGNNQTLQATYTVPAGKTAYAVHGYISLSGKTTANIIGRLLMRPDGGVFNIKEEIALIGAGSSSYIRPWILPTGPIAAKTDIYATASSDTNATGVSAGFDLLLVDD